MSTVCTLYQQALRLHQQGVHLICCDEKTGMQALERLYPTKAAIPGSVERQEAHYIRHGTQNLIANFEVATGRILAPTLAPTRSEAEFAHHVLQTLTRDLDGEWIFIVDNLNTPPIRIPGPLGDGSVRPRGGSGEEGTPRHPAFVRHSRRLPGR